MAKVYVGLSGGVDSAVSAALLKEQGYDVTGVFIKIWSPEFLECTWREDRLDAMRVAVHLGIPFREIDLSREYHDSVVEDMLRNYTKGITPNPDVLCNRTIKFGAFADWAFENGADLIATGHYARIEKRDHRHVLLKGIDPSKDQSYFLYRLNEKDLSRTLFPVGGFEKKEIRKKAEHFGLPNSKRPDSQGLRLVGDVSMHEFLSRFISLERGKLQDISGREIGEHDGAALYTTGQRHGFHLAADAPEGPYYVVSVDTNTNIVVVSKERAATERERVDVIDVHWIHAPVDECDVVPRYHAPSVRAHVDSASVTFMKPLQATPGQSLVFYERAECLGGAIIQPIQDQGIANRKHAV